MRRPRTSLATTRATRATRAGVLGMLVVLLLATGCAAMPESGPVVDAEVPTAIDARAASDIDPAPPQHDESAEEVVNGFLAAMTASPIRTDVAREYLTASAAETWNPTSTITYSSKAPPRDRGDEITVSLVDADRLAPTGAWRGRVAPNQDVLRFRVVFERGEFRIDNPPNALIVPETWFAQRFQEASLYFFDPTAEILVPQPVFVPVGAQFASALAGGLLAGPGQSLSRVVRSFVPAQLSLSPSVTVSRDGIADISLGGSPGRLSSDTVQRMLTQFAWTLQQDPTIRGITISINHTPVPLPGGERDFSTGQPPASLADPNGYLASTRLYGLRGGVVVTSNGAGFQPTTGPLGTQQHHLRSLAIDLPGERVAAVTSDGERVLEAPTGTAAGDTLGSAGSPGLVLTGRVRTVVSGAGDLLPPAWDYAKRLWLIDRNDGAAEVSYVAHGRRHRLEVPGLSGLRVRSFLVSRDGTRLVAVVAGRDRDTLRIARIESDQRGRILHVTRAVVVPGPPSDPPRIRDVAWTSPTTVAILAPLVGRISEVRTAWVDGSPTGPDDLATTVSGSIDSLAASPSPGRSAYAVTSTGLVDLGSSTLTPFVGDQQITSIDYVG